MRRNKISREKRKTINRSAKWPCEICKKSEFLVDHHINGRAISNYNHSSNRCNICSNCHKSVHEGLIVIEGWFMTTSGLTLLWHSVNKSSFSGRDSRPYIIP